MVFVVGGWGWYLWGEFEVGVEVRWVVGSALDGLYLGLVIVSGIREWV